jgi:hypothetical protein
MESYQLLSISTLHKSLQVCDEIEECDKWDKVGGSSECSSIHLLLVTSGACGQASAIAERI